MTNKIYYEVLKSIVANNSWDSALGQEALELEKTLSPAFYYVEPKAHLINFLNAYLVEKAFKDAYPGHLEFNDPDRHYALYEGKGKPGTDFHDDIGRQIDAKMFKTQEKLDNWLNKTAGTFEANHGADLLLIYVRSTKKSWVYVCATGELYLAKEQINPKLF